MLPIDKAIELQQSFNSLFEMRVSKPSLRQMQDGVRFNSLFEMPEEEEYEELLQRYPQLVSILYLRCHLLPGAVQLDPPRRFNSLFEMPQRYA